MILIKRELPTAVVVVEEVVGVLVVVEGSMVIVEVVSTMLVVVVSSVVVVDEVSETVVVVVGNIVVVVFTPPLSIECRMVPPSPTVNMSPLVLPKIR